jgi:hypothetical protein
MRTIRAPLGLAAAVVVGLVMLAGCNAETAASAHSPSLAPSPSLATSPVSSSDPCGTGAYCVLNPSVSQATIKSTICVSGWTATVRPPTNYTTPLKVAQIAELHLSGTANDYEEDHRMPLELGGDPSSSHNLSPEAHVSLGGRSEEKDRDENAFKYRVCSRLEGLTQSQREFVARWLDVWPKYRTEGPSPVPTATPAPTAVPTAPPVPAPLSVQVTVSAYGSFAAVTAPGAVCSARARLPSGSYSAAQGLVAQPTADQAGSVRWTYGTSSRTIKGTGTHFVTCTLAAESVSSQATFVV